ncbi:IS30 family transposase, partial [Streptococcus dysgalactiae subsp. equisimilis]
GTLVIYELVALDLTTCEKDYLSSEKQSAGIS